MTSKDITKIGKKKKRYFLMNRNTSEGFVVTVSTHTACNHQAKSSHNLEIAFLGAVFPVIVLTERKT